MRGHHALLRHPEQHHLCYQQSTIAIRCVVVLEAGYAPEHGEGDGEEEACIEIDKGDMPPRMLDEEGHYEEQHEHPITTDLEEESEDNVRLHTHTPMPRETMMEEEKS